MTDINIVELKNTIKKEIMNEIHKSKGLYFCSICSVSSLETKFSKYNKYCAECFKKKAHTYYLNKWKVEKYQYKTTGRAVGRPRKENTINTINT
jgi:hypothetical protein